MSTRQLRLRNTTLASPPSAKYWTEKRLTNLARGRLANLKTGGTVLNTPQNKRKIAALRSAYPNVKRKKIKNPKTGRMILDTVANWRKMATWAKQEVKKYIALRALQLKSATDWH